MNPFLTVYGPRPEAWWAVCNLCSQTSQDRFESAEGAGDWEHDCHLSKNTGPVVVSITLSEEDPPAISFEKPLVGSQVDEMRHAINDLRRWTTESYVREKHATWIEAIQHGWAARRKQATDRLISAAEEALKRPHVCPGCKERYMKPGGLKRHMRACYRIDPFKMERGEYDAAMAPGAEV